MIKFYKLLNGYFNPETIDYITTDEDGGSWIHYADKQIKVAMGSEDLMEYLGISIYVPAKDNKKR